MSKFKEFIRACDGMRAFKNLPQEKRAIVVYSEGNGSSPHLMPIVEALTSRHKISVTYLTSEINDRILFNSPPCVRAFFIGSGSVRTWLFKTLKARCLLMTMPDLESFHIKKSIHPVHYIYTHHSMVSTHMIYRKGAFDHFNTVFCVGPHHEKEIRKTEKIYNLPAKNLFHHGYPRLDSLAAKYAGLSPLPERIKKRILIAPSWGPNSLLETSGLHLIDNLLNLGFFVTVRPHPMTYRTSKKILKNLQKSFEGNPNFDLENDVEGAESLLSCDLMVSDWSGAALEYAFFRERPVLFIDVPRKVNNQDWQKIGIVPLEESIRNDLGAILRPDEFGKLEDVIRNLIDNKNSYQQKIRSARCKYVYNFQKSAKIAAEYIIDLVD